MLDQHFAHIGRCDSGIDGLTRMFEKLLFRGGEALVVLVGRFDHVAQRFEDSWQIDFELFDRLAELGDFRPLIRKKEREQPA